MLKVAVQIKMYTVFVVHKNENNLYEYRSEKTSFRKEMQNHQSAQKRLKYNTLHNINL